MISILKTNNPDSIMVEYMDFDDHHRVLFDMSWYSTDDLLLHAQNLADELEQRSIVGEYSSCSGA